MGIPTISERKHYRLVPGEPEELTSTIVLTSKDSYFVDVRLFKDKLEEERGKDENTEACIQWAFAGRSHATPQGARKDGMIQLSHTVWDHWIDSKSNDPDKDEGDMWVQKNGDVLERGKNSNPETGEEIEYEELWHDLEVESMGKKHNHSSVVMRAENSEKNLKGMVVKVGGWCQGIMKVGDELTVERWEHKLGSVSDNQQEAVRVQQNGGWRTEKGRTRNDWIRTFKLGKGFLPCKDIVEETSGKLGLNHVVKDHPNYWESATEWRVLEEYHW
ncbi:hypothetical protein P7C71_g3004, partial [Lecanoromycetidae sp. Uapishka_2]